MSPLSRRTVLRRGSTVFTLVLAGCSSTVEDDSSDRSGTVSVSTVKLTTTSSTEPRETRPATITGKTKQYTIGQWHTDRKGDWRTTVERAELLTSFETDEGKTYQMPTDEQLLVASISLENSSTSAQTYAGGLFDALVRGSVYEDTAWFSHPSRDSAVQIDELANVGKVTRYYSEGRSIGPGEEIQTWLVFVLPRNVSRQDIEIRYKGSEDDSSPARWRLDTASANTTETPTTDD